MTRALRAALVEQVRTLDTRLLGISRPVRAAVFLTTALVMIAVSLPNVPRQYLDYSHTALLQGVQQRETYGTDTLSDMYGARVVLNDVTDMYTKKRLEQTPLEAATWSKEASAPYPPVVLLTEAALYAAGDWIGIGFYGMILGLACVFLTLSAAYFWKTRWHLFPLLYLNFSYVSERFVYVQDSTYLIMLVVVFAALLLARARRGSTHILMALAITLKLSPLYYIKNLPTMRALTALAFVFIVVAGLVLPYFIWDNYLYIYRYANELKGGWSETAGAVAIAVPFAVVLAYVEARLAFDLEDRVGWGLVPFAMFLGLKMNVARHLLIVLLVPDKRGLRNLAASIGLGLPALFPWFIRANSALWISTAVLIAALIYYLDQIGWDVVREDMRHPKRTIKIMMGSGFRVQGSGFRF
jgi:hypothetical protein